MVVSNRVSFTSKSHVVIEIKCANNDFLTGNSDTEAAVPAIPSAAGPSAAVPVNSSSSGRGMGSRMGSFFRRDRSDDENSEFDIPVGDSPEANAARGVVSALHQVHMTRF
jgi:hypothetical protein